MSASSSARRCAGAVAGVALVAAAGGCSAGWGPVLSSSSGAATPATPASAGVVPQVGQVIATAPLTAGGTGASGCGGRDGVAREALVQDARARGWIVDRMGSDERGCVAWGSALLAGGQRAPLLVEEDRAAGMVSLRVVDVRPSSSAVVASYGLDMGAGAPVVVWDWAS